MCKTHCNKAIMTIDYKSIAVKWTNFMSRG